MTTQAIIKELVIARVFDAPREMVFNAWTDPKQFEQWWGPKVFTNSIHEFDVRPGGQIHLVMHGPGNFSHPMNGVFHEIKEPELLVFTSSAFADENGNDQLQILNTINFEEQGNKTKVTMLAQVIKAGPGTEMGLNGMEEGWSQSIDKLDALVSKTGEREIVNIRVMKAPRQLVFKAWTDPELLAQWWGPNGFTNTFNEFDLTPGGYWRFIMHGPDGKDYPNESQFIEIRAPHRIMFHHVSKPQFRITATFEACSDTETLLTFRMLFNTADEYNSIKDFATPKNEENFDRLENVLAQLQ